jgi:D-alanyl-D-alanine carboxypeptidase (penicillin-binding protein 5/6)
MRLKVVLITIILGVLAGESVFFVFTYPLNINSEYLGANPAQDQTANPPVQAQQAFLLPLSESDSSPVRDFSISEPQVDAKAVILYDASSNNILFSKNAEKRLPIASITKLMTAIVILDNLSLEDVYTVRPEDINAAGLGADLYNGEKIKAGDLLEVMLVKSSNDAALTFAFNAKNRGTDIVAKMNEEAATLGMGNTHFADPAGLDDGATFSTAGDLVRLVRQVLNYPLILKILTSKSADVSSTDGTIVHHLINTDQLLRQIPSIIVGKTGFTDLALGTMALAVKINQGKATLISVVLGSNDRFGETKKLIDWGKSAYFWQ